MKVSALQMDISWEDRSKNYARARDFADRAASDGADLFILPEMFSTGFSMNPSVTAEERHGDTYSFLSDLAKEKDMGVIGGVVFKGEGGKGINSAIAFDRKGVELACYAKTHLFSVLEEQKHHIAGDGPAPFEFEGTRISCFVCYDLRFPELFRLVAEEVDVAVLIASWPNPRQKHFNTLLEARAIENQHYVVGVNRVGKGGGLEFSGGSVILDPMGQALAAGGDKECLISGEIDLDMIKETRRFMLCHRDRRF